MSIAVVSYALNGRPGVSASTRGRVLRVADEFGWRPSASARSLRGDARAVGLALGRSSAPGTHDGAVLDLVSALQDVLSQRGLALVLQMVSDEAEEAALYGQWWSERRVDAIVVLNPLLTDSRLEALRRLRAPSVVVGASPFQDEYASVTVDDGDGVARVGRYLLELGHQEIAVVSGPGALVRTQARIDGLGGIVLGAGGRLLHEATTGSAEAAAAATRRLTTGRPAPTAIVYDSDLAAIAALDVARRSGLAVPWDLSVVAASDSALCRLSTPSVTALPATQHALGTAAGEVLIDVLGGDRTARRHVKVGGLAVRGSTGPRSR